MLVTGAVIVLVGLVSRIEPAPPITRVPSVPPNTRSAPPPPTAQASQPLDQMPSGMAEQPPNPVFGAIGQALLALAILAAIALVVFVAFRVVTLLRDRPPPEGIDAADTEPVVDLVEIQRHLEQGSLEIDVTGEVNAAVVRCWQGLEAAAGSAGTPRLPSQTAREYTVAVLSSAALPAGPLDALAGVYEQALFSAARLTEADRDVAVESLRRLLEAIDRPADRGSRP